MEKEAWYERVKSWNRVPLSHLFQCDGNWEDATACACCRRCASLDGRPPDGADLIEDLFRPPPMFEIMLPGSEVKVGDVEMTILKAAISGSGPSLEYYCAWWNEGMYHECWFETFVVRSSGERRVGLMVGLGQGAEGTNGKPEKTA